MSDATPNTTADVLSRVDRAWTSLEGTVGRLSPAQLTELRDPAGWAVKDHLMHVAVWEDAFVARLEGRPFGAKQIVFSQLLVAPASLR